MVLKKLINILSKVLALINNNHNALLFITTLIGFIFITFQNIQISKQTKIMEETLTYTVAPLCVVSSGNNIIGILSVKDVDNEDDKIYRFGNTKFILSNKSQGILNLIGTFTYIMIDPGVPLNIRDLFLEGKIDTSKIRFDEEFTIDRNRIVAAGDSTTTTVDWAEIKVPLNWWILLYSIVLYKDSRQNLYDTVYITSIRINKHLSGTEEIPVSSHYSNNFHKYDEKEKNQLEAVLYKTNHPLVEFIDK